MEGKEYDCLKKLATKIRLRRYELSLSQLELAERANCSLNAIGRIERIETDPCFTTIIKIAWALELSPKDLLPM